MSAPRPNLPNGQNPTPAKRPPPFRRPRPANPLVTRKNDPTKSMGRPASTQRPPTAPAKAAPKDPLEALKEQDEMRLKNFEAQRKQNGGWTDPPPPAGEYQEFPLVISKRALREGMRFHVMRFAKAKGGNVDHSVDPTDPDDFTRPVTLHRRDPRQPPPGREVKEEPVVEEPPPQTVDEKEAERLAQIKAEREAQRAIDLAQIAPSVKTTTGDPAPKKTQKKEKPFNAHFHTKKDADPKASELRYEEALPWHIEDADGKNVWVGSYVAALSQANVGLVISGAGFRMIPLEKYYRFISKPPFKAFTIDEAEARMKQKVEMAIFAKKSEQAKLERAEMDATRRFLGGTARVKLESSTYRAAPRSEKVDHDDLDMSGDEFQDDDENPGIERDNDEDAKESRDRQRRNHLGANLFGQANEKEVEREEMQKELEDMLRKIQGKKVRKALTRHEKHLEYASDNSEENPYESSSSEDEVPAEDEKKQEEKEKEKGKEADAKDKKAGAKGSNTPSSKQKQSDAAKAAKSLKRPGSPNLSESSGNESSRKKAKKQATGSVQPSRSSTPLPGQQRVKGRGAGGAASDGEATGGEMSDGGVKKKRVKLGVAGRAASGTPAGSRAGSPAPSQGALGSASNAASPKKGTPDGSRSVIVSGAELLAVLEANPQGIAIGDLLKRYFSDRVGDGEGKLPRKEFIQLVTKHAIFRKEDRLLLAKPK